MSPVTNLLIGILAGLTGGVLMAIATIRVFQFIIKTIAQKLQLA